MAGIYIHIPFCRKKCYYCDFYKSVNTGRKRDLINALKKEAELRKGYLKKEQVNTVYFGGGTPSVLTIEEVNEILYFINQIYSVSSQAEITFEANPDDLEYSYITELKKSGVNRLSIGVQAFQDDLLMKMNRRHNTSQAVVSVMNAHKAGFENISIDLIYGLPGLTANDWRSNLKKAFELPVDHLSAYHLTYHKRTVFFSLLKKGLLKEISEDESIGQFNILIEESGKAGFEQYEISNFAKDRRYSKHNTSYWTGEKYLGLGPSAHSYNVFSRQWNISNIEKYINLVENGEEFYKEEILTENDKFNEYIITNIRTKWGVSFSALEEKFGKEKAGQFLSNSQKYISSQRMIFKNGIFYLTREGLFISDDITAGLMII